MAFSRGERLSPVFRAYISEGDNGCFAEGSAVTCGDGGDDASEVDGGGGGGGGGGASLVRLCGVEGPRGAK